MDRRTIVKGGAVALGVSALPGIARAQSAPSSIRIGYVTSLSGPFAPGAQSTSWSQYKLWAKDVNDAGGLELKKFGRKVPVELIEYDDRSQLDEAIKLTERLILQDKVDLVLPPWGTGNNLAVAPVVNRHGYPTLFWTCTGAKTRELARRWPFAFFPLCQPDDAAVPLARMLADMKAKGQIKGRIAAVHAAEQFGVDLHSAFIAEFTKAGLEVVLNKSYPLSATDLSPLIREAKALEPDAFIASSYPTDTFQLTEQAIVAGFNPQIFYTGIGTPFPGFRAKFGNRVNGVMMYGGHERGAPGQKEYMERHRAMWNRETESGAIGMYGCLQVLQQAIERVGEIDRKRIRDEIAGGSFQTVFGTFRFKDQLMENPWAAAQWQNGEVVAILPSSRKGAQPLAFPKPTWG